MYLAGVSVRRVEDITEALWGTRVSPSTVSDLNKKIYGTIEAWRNRPIEGEHPYVYLDGIVLKRSWAGEVRNVSLLVAIGVNGEGYREILGICEGAKEDKAGWSGFLKHLKERGLKGVRLIISDACMGLSESAAEFFPEAGWQRCVVHWYRNVFSHVPSTKVREVAAMLKAIHAGEDLEAARQQVVRVIEKIFRTFCWAERRPALAYAVNRLGRIRECPVNIADVSGQFRAGAIAQGSLLPCCPYALRPKTIGHLAP
jgi:putative transposase